jgi:hypothetical protein
MAAARASSRYGHRDSTMILIGYRHGLRASELVDLQWHQVELTTGRLHVRRAKGGSPSVHTLQDDEIRALRRLQREQAASSHVFMTERGGPMTPKAFHALFARIGVWAKMPLPVHTHMLRHGCGCPGQCRPRHAVAAGLAWAQEYPARSTSPSWRRIGSRAFGRTEMAKRPTKAPPSRADRAAKEAEYRAWKVRALADLANRRPTRFWRVP